jgi:excisionase family DNA binding protein
MNKDNNITQPLEAYSLRVNPPKNLSVIEAVRYLTCSERKLRDEIAEGNLKVCRFGSRIIVRLKDLDNYLDQLPA